MNSEKVTVLKGYGDGCVTTLGTTAFDLKIDEIDIHTTAEVVPDYAQQIPLLIGQKLTEMPDIVVYKDANILTLSKFDAQTPKATFWPKDTLVIPPNHVGNVKLVTRKPATSGDYVVEADVRYEPGQEYAIPRTLVNYDNNKTTYLPVLNLSERDLIITAKHPIVRAWLCQPEKTFAINRIQKVAPKNRKPLFVRDLNVGPVSTSIKEKLQQLIDTYRHCFATDVRELGEAKSMEMTIELKENQTFTYRPYRMSLSEKQTVKEVVADLLEAGIIRESNSPFSSPIVLVKKKDGSSRMCVDYRKLNNLTVKDRFPLPRIDDQIDKMHGSAWFTTLDLISGYHQVPVAKESKAYTSFVTPDGQYEYNRMPFGLCNAPSVFQRLMNKLFTHFKDLAAVYLDDMLIPSATPEQNLEKLEKVLKILEMEGLTLNPEKCKFLYTSVSYLGFEIAENGVKPGAEKVSAIKNFPTPKDVHNIRQFIGLTGYFRHFVNNYATVAEPLTRLTRKSIKWEWGAEQEFAFNQMKQILTCKPVLKIYSPEAKTEVHTDASSRGLGGILLQRHQDKMHPVFYYSRQTANAETKYHSYELETLAVVETLKKFRVYLLDKDFVVVTDCNALKAAWSKRDLLPRIARWWLLLQEYHFTVEYRPGTKMKHVDALSRNPDPTEPSSLTEYAVMRIEPADWVLSAQLTDAKIQQVLDILSKPPQTDYERQIYKNYALRNDRLYRITVRGLQWVVPKGMRQRVVRASHDDMGHFSLEKTLDVLCNHYWFPNMKAYVEKYISCCVACIYSKPLSGRKEGYLHPIDKVPVPFHTVHIDHLGPFNKSGKGNRYLIVLVDAFTKYVLMKAVKSTKTKCVTKFLEYVFSVYGIPTRLVDDRGTSFTSTAFQNFCKGKGVVQIKNAVATPRANGQVERYNRTILSSLAAYEDDINWDTYVARVQFAINNTIHKDTRKTPNELLMGYRPRGGSDAILLNEVVVDEQQQNLDQIRLQAAERIRANQAKNKVRFDAKRKAPNRYKIGDLVAIEKASRGGGASNKLVPKFDGPMVVKEILPNDRYHVSDLSGSHRRNKGAYDNVIAVDHIKPWMLPGGVSDSYSEDDREDGVPTAQETDSDT